MNDFWLSCGHHLLDRDEEGRLRVTDDFLKVYLARPELTPPADACSAERALHAALMADPRRAVSAADIAAIADADARENWQFMLAFRDHLVAYPTLEAAYLALVRSGKTFPPIFFDQLVHVILRNVLDGCDDPFVLRAAELFFRPQRLTVHEGSLLTADAEQIDAVATPGTPLSPLVAMLGLPSADIDVLGDDNAADYWQRSDQFDMALDLTAGRRGLAALAEVMERWLSHMIGVEVAVEPLVELRDAPLVWYVGFDAHATTIGDALWNGEEIDEDMRACVVGLFRLSFRDPNAVIERVAGEPVYVILAMTTDKLMRTKPQNLLTGLPVKHLEAAN
jgi:hypothetical protein